MWEPDPLVEDWKSRRRIRRLVVVLGSTLWLACVAMVQWGSAPTACDEARSALTTLTWRGALAADVVGPWSEDRCEAVVVEVRQARASGSWADTLCTALEHVDGEQRLADEHAWRVADWNHTHCGR